MSKTYHGDRTIDGIVVTVDGEALSERTDVKQFTDLGFEWTYVGDSSKQLALAILCDHLNDTAKALSLTDGFTASVIARLNNEWTMTSADVQAAVDQLAPDRSRPAESA